MQSQRKTIQQCLVTALVLAALSNTTAVVDANSPTWAAIAFSRSTGRYGWASRCDAKADAENSALSSCRASDATVLVSTTARRLALALGHRRGAYGYAWGSDNADVENRALTRCAEHTCHPYVAVSFGNVR